MNDRRKNLCGFALLCLATFAMFAGLWWSLSLQHREPVAGPPLAHAFSDGTRIELTEIGFHRDLMGKTTTKAWSPYGIAKPAFGSRLRNYGEFGCRLELSGTATDFDSQRIVVESNPRTGGTSSNRTGFTLYYTQTFDGLWQSSPTITVRYGTKKTERRVQLSPNMETPLIIAGKKWQLVAPDRKSGYRPSPGKSMASLRTDAPAPRLIADLGTLEVRMKDGTVKQFDSVFSSSKSLGWDLNTADLSSIASWYVVHRPHPETVTFSEFARTPGKAADPKITPR